MRLIARSFWLILILVPITIAVPVILSGTLRSAYVLTLHRKLASIWPPEYAFVGDSLTANCNWRKDLGKLSIINFAVGGTDIRDVAHQLVQAVQLKPHFIFIEAGINDLILESASIEQIGHDFEYLLRQLPAFQKAVVTLIPFVSAQSLTDKIELANSAIKRLVESRGIPIIDLNPRLADRGIRKREMTTDGVHFTDQACQIWASEIRAKANLFY